MKKKREIEMNASTEEKIKEAARRVFMEKGYAGTRTRDIAEASGYNLALINYYFRSKEKLFDIIMLEHLQSFVHSVFGILDDPNTTLLEKIEIMIGHYIDMLIKNPDIPIFILNETRTDPGKLFEKVGVTGEKEQQLYVTKQWQEMTASGMMPNINPSHIMMNVIALTIFPFIGRPLIQNRLGLKIAQFNTLMEERKKLIPIWVRAILNVHQQ